MIQMRNKEIYERMNNDLRSKVKEVINREDVKYVIGYGNGSYAGRTKPIFIRTDEETDNLVWSPLGVNNLPVVLKHEEKLPVPRGQEPDTRKIGIVVKGCDVRALYQLMQEQFIRRDDIVIIISMELFFNLRFRASPLSTLQLFVKESFS